MGHSTVRGDLEPEAADGTGRLSPHHFEWLWRLATEVQACDTVAAAEGVAERAEGELVAGGGGSALAAAFAETVGPALANVRDRERLHGLAIRDPLTGLHNRRFMDEELARQIDHATTLGQPLAVALLDVDLFRDFNERHGHRAGDMVLRSVGLVIQGFLREHDQAGRYGGEEFVVLMPDTTATAAGTRLEPLRAALAGLAVHHEGRRLEPVTASIGVAECPMHGTTVAALVDAADAALYRGKRLGRNQICIAANPGDTR